MTDTEIIEVLATKGMGWERCVQFTSHFKQATVHWWTDLKTGGDRRVSDWNPLTDRNAVAEIEARLTNEQKQKYVVAIYSILMDIEENSRGLWTEWEYRHASPRVCCEALVNVLT